MKKWQNMSSRFLVLVLLSANFVGLAPIVQGATEESAAVAEEVVTKDSDAPQESKDSETSGSLSTTEQTSVSSSEAVSSQSLPSSESASASLGATSKTTKASSETATSDSEEETDKKTIPVQLLGLNDYHGAIDLTGTAYLGSEKFTNVGRASNLAVHLDQAEAAFKEKHSNGASERIQGGDLVGASPANSALLQDEPTIKIFNKIKFTIGTIGNHEFDQGLGEFRRILDGVPPKEGQFNSIVDNYPREASNMEVVLANVVNKADGEHGKQGQIPYEFSPYTIKEYGSGEEAVKIGYIGIVTTEFPNLVLKQHHEKYDVLDEAATIVKYSKELRNQGVNAIVIVSHLAATSSQEVVQGEVADVMGRVNDLDPDNSVDVVFAGHNHQFTNGVIKGPKNDVRVVQSTSQGKAYIDLQGELDVETKDFAEVPKAEVKPTTELENKNQEIVNIVAEANELVKTVTEDKVGTADQAATEAGLIAKVSTEHSESPVGNLVTEAQLYMAQNGGYLDEAGKPIKVDFALTNNGGIRADLKVKENGDITWGAAQLVQPFGNILQLVEISGKDLIGALNEQHPVGKEHYFLQIAGMKMTYTKDETGFKVDTVTDAEGNEIDEEKKYVIVINDFLLGGGDGFASFTKGKLLQAMDTDTNIFIKYFELKEKAGEKIAAPATDRKQLVTPSNENVVPIQMLGLNDYHGAIDVPGTAYLEDGKHPNVGRASNLAVHLDQATTEFLTENQNGVSERVQAGDLVGASPANSALLQDEPTIRIFNEMKFGIGTIGNHEFDQGLAEFKRILNGTKPVEGQFNPIVDNYPREKSTMDVVLANVVNKAKGDHGEKGEVPYGFEPYVVKEYGDGTKKVKVGYIGIVTTEFPNLVLKQHHEQFDVLDEADTIVKYSQELRNQGVNAIVIVSHLAATSSQEVVKGEVLDVMTKVNSIDPDNSVDIVFAGHNHQFTNGVIKGPKNDVRVVQSTSQGKAYIDLKGELDFETQDFVTTPTAKVKPTTHREDKNEKIVAIVEEANELVKTVTEEKVGTADAATAEAGLIAKASTEHSESPVGNLVTDAQLYMAQNGNYLDKDDQPIKVDFALTNNGGIRADLTINENGEITWGAAQLVQPFGNILQLVEISGKDLIGALNEQHPVGKEHYFLQIAGMKMTYTKDETGFKVETVTDAEGNKINEEQKYVIVINDFLLGGGDGFASFTKGKLLQAMDTDTNTFIKYFELKEQAGEKITAPATDRKQLATTEPEVPETPVTEEQLREATKINPITVGDSVITGKTLPKAVLSFGEKVTATADEDGEFTLTLEQKITAATPITITVTVGEVSVAILTDVLEKPTEPGEVQDPEELLKASSISKLTAGDKVIKGQSLPGTTVTYAPETKARALPLTATADETGNYQLSLKAGLEAGQTVTLAFTLNGTTVEKTKKVAKAVVTEEQLREATKINPITVGDSVITGKTLPKAILSFGEKVTATADEKGQFTLTLEQKITAATPITITVTVGEVSVAILTDVLEKPTEPGGVQDPEELLKASSISKLTAGDTVIKGQSLPGTTVTYVPVTKARALPLTATADKTGNYQLNLKTGLEAGQRVTLAFTLNGTTVEITEKVGKAPVTEPLEITKELLEETTVINPITVGDQTITGKTLAGAVVNYRLKTADQVILGTTTADKDGNFSLKVTKALKANSVLLLDFTIADISITREATVAKAKGTNNSGGNNGNHSNKPGGSQYLPQTGEEKAVFGLVSIGLVLVGYSMYLKRETNELSQ
ncbi:5'-nucleotidase C-terminal domain-containing protein [Vagococcus salmoninarum]|uniref:bifunctional metallophosphatase/5'-nucleotidase n=1 Tax=Vagococcus salmoninarum TaxID=2739 RepID=UPI003F9CBE46